jgi:hypothetical protein
MRTFAEALEIIQEANEAAAWKTIGDLEIPWNDSTPAHVSVSARIQNGKLEVEIETIEDDRGNEIHFKKEEEVIDAVLKKYRENIMKELK